MSKRAIVTGASSGIGQEFARQLAHAGWTVTGVARSAAKLSEQLAALPGSGHQPLRADLSTAEGIDAVIAELQAAPYDLLINNAGVAAFGLFETVPMEKLRAMAQLNLEPVYRLSHAYLQTARAGDALINVASVEGLMPFPGQALYAATKAFVVSLSESLWYEQRRRGVYVMALCPGVTRTALLPDAAFDSIPKLLVGAASGVVSTALSALRRRKRPTVIPGALNKATVFSSRVLSRRATTRLMGSLVPRETLEPAPAPIAALEEGR